MNVTHMRAVNMEASSHMNVSEVRQKIESEVSNVILQGAGLSREIYDDTATSESRQLPALPLRPAKPTPDSPTQSLMHALAVWRQTFRPPTRGRLAVVTGPTGVGKTIMSCVLQRQLAMTLEDKVAFWISGAQLAESSLGEQPLCSLTGLDDPRHQLSCFIIDGLEEHVRPWAGLDALLADLVARNIPTVMTINDTSLGPHFVKTIGPHWSPRKWHRFEIQPWRDSDLLRYTLGSYLLDFVPTARWQEYCERNRHESPEHVCRELVRSVPMGTLESPLLFGLTVDILLDRITALQRPEPQSAPEPLTSASTLTSAWIEGCLLRGQRPVPPPSSPERRRQAARRLAFYLSVSGLETSGVSIDELDTTELAWIWEPLEPCSESGHSPMPGYDQVVRDQEFAKRVNELASSCLLRARSSPQGTVHDRLVPFHSHLLVHLTREFIDCFLAGEEQIKLPAGLEANAELDDLLHAAVEASGRRQLHALGSVLRQHLGEQAMAPDSHLSKAIAYQRADHHVLHVGFTDIELATHYFRFPESTGPAASPPSMEFLRANDARCRRQLGAVMLLLGVAEDTGGESLDSLVIRDKRYLPLPPASYLVWGEEDGCFQPQPVCGYRGCFMAESLVTVAEFAPFLQERRDEPAGPGWQRDSQTHAITASPAKADEPVRGIPADQAHRYCLWLNETLRADPKFHDHGIRVRMPTVTDFQVAVAGTRLVQPRPYAPGPFGHLHLLCETQHLAEEEEHESFGWPLSPVETSPTMKDLLDVVLGRYPDLVDAHELLSDAHSMLALRVVVELGEGVVVEKGGLALAGAGAPPPGGDPSGSDPAGSAVVSDEHDLGCVAGRLATETSDHMEVVRDVVSRQYAATLPENGYAAWLHILVHVLYRDRQRAVELVRLIADELPPDPASILNGIADDLRGPEVWTLDIEGES